MEEIRNRFSGLEKPEPERKFVHVLEKINANKDITIPGKSRNEEKRPTALSHESLDTRLEPSDLDSLISEKAHRYGVDEDLVRSVIKMESGGNPRATSKAGAMGLMQLMPSTAEMLGVKDPYDPEQNLDGGIRYLKTLLDRYKGREDLSLAAYHSGPSRVDRYGGIPPHPKVKHYVKCVLAMTSRARGE